MFKNVLIPTDGSAPVRKAVTAGVALARDLGASVTAYHALEVFQPYAFAEGALVDEATLSTFDQHARAQAQKYIDEVEKACRKAGVSFDALVTKPITPHEGIIAAAKKKKCDCIFMGSHGRGEVASLILGSVTQKVLAHSRIPVLVYR
jgi:nucleotide-binding universal stress UspA family protein